LMLFISSSPMILSHLWPVILYPEISMRKCIFAVYILLICSFFNLQYSSPYIDVQWDLFLAFP
jgi:hypothetical protein